MVRQPNKKSASGPRSGAELVEIVLRKYGLVNPLREQRLITRWVDIVGERLATRTWPDGLKNGVLYVRVVNSAWMHELSFLQGTIMEQANLICHGPPLVKEVRLHVGRLRHPEDKEDVLAALARQRPNRS